MIAIEMLLLVLVIIIGSSGDGDNKEMIVQIRRVLVIKPKRCLLPSLGPHGILQFYFFQPNCKMVQISFQQLLGQVSQVSYMYLVQVSGLFYQSWFLNQMSTGEGICGKDISVSQGSMYLII